MAIRSSKTFNQVVEKPVGFQTQLARQKQLGRQKTFVVFPSKVFFGRLVVAHNYLVLNERL